MIPKARPEQSEYIRHLQSLHDKVDPEVNQLGSLSFPDWLLEADPNPTIWATATAWIGVLSDFSPYTGEPTSGLLSRPERVLLRSHQYDALSKDLHVCQSPHNFAVLLLEDIRRESVGVGYREPVPPHEEYSYTEENYSEFCNALSAPSLSISDWDWLRLREMRIGEPDSEQPEPAL
jgi:hypothetical protein